ncbi:MAG: VWA domain-containing protein, partial [Planctomycetota bacterium]
AVWASLTLLQAMAPVRRVCVALTQTAWIALLSLTLAGASTVRQSDRLAVIALVDVSASVRELAAAAMGASPLERAKQWLLEAAAEAGPEDLLGVVAFDGAAVATLAPRRASSIVAEDLAFDVRLREGTNIAAAIRLARALAPVDAALRLVLISDGVETEGDALRAAQEQAGTPLDVAPIVYRLAKEAMVEFVEAPARARPGAPVPVRVGLRANSEVSGWLRLFVDEKPVNLDPETPSFARRVTFGPGLRVERAEVELSEDPAHRLVALFEPDEGLDTSPANNRAETVTLTPGKGRALIVDGFAGPGGQPSAEAKALAALLRKGGLDSRILPPAGAPSGVLRLQSYDLIALLNVAADELPSRWHRQLAQAVEDMGVGLLALGGPKSLGAGAWKGSALEPLLPVKLDVPDEVVAPAAAIGFLIDASGSMASSVLGSSRTQQEIANESVAAAIGALSPDDIVGVWTFDMAVHEVVPPGPLKNPQKAAQRARSIAPGGGTNLYPALREAGRAVAAQQAETKHLIVLSDGQSVGSAADGVKIARELRRQGVSVTAIALGDQADVRTLRSIADAGGGQFYEVVDPLTLPRIFVREIRIVRTPLVKTGRIPVHMASSTGSPLAAVLLEAGSPPPLAGLTLSSKRAASEAIVLVQTQEDGFPVLAHWSAGLGRTAVFASTPGAWAGQWRSWPGWEPLWTQLAQLIARPAGGVEGAELSLRFESDQALLTLLVQDADGRPVDGLVVDGAVLTDDNQRIPVALRQTGPGRYEGAAAAPGEGVVVAAITPKRAGRTMGAVVAAAARPLGRERRALQSNLARLEELARVTGGRRLSLNDPASAQGVFAREAAAQATARSPLWPTLLPWALVALVLDVANRRIAWDRFLPSGEELKKRSRRELAARSSQAAATTGRLSAMWRRSRRPRAQTPRELRQALGAAAAKRTAGAETEQRQEEKAQASKAQERALADVLQEHAQRKRQRRRAQEEGTKGGEEESASVR